MFASESGAIRFYLRDCTRYSHSLVRPLYPRTRFLQKHLDNSRSFGPRDTFISRFPLPLLPTPKRVPLLRPIVFHSQEP